MKNLFDLLFLVVGLTGLALGFASRTQLTAEGRSIPWYRRYTPIYRTNPFYSPKGQTMVRVSGILMFCSALLLIAMRFMP